MSVTRGDGDAPKQGRERERERESARLQGSPLGGVQVSVVRLSSMLIAGVNQPPDFLTHAWLLQRPFNRGCRRRRKAHGIEMAILASANRTDLHASHERIRCCCGPENKAKTARLFLHGQMVREEEAWAGVPWGGGGGRKRGRSETAATNAGHGPRLLLHHATRTTKCALLLSPSFSPSSGLEEEKQGRSTRGANQRQQRETEQT
ncbi:hypothetical protein B0J12DRAFT_140100 [Macrophomina phaseolina]|uniref:Uncharacterized protein n=1 Tax=Macrophomina phaseolina TaxID=35725 RepID=A0ABQ8GAA3_9PEZI|nr:hypothetical protein B0J12DRAFT_140100 [Macrophomina phaseolina]